MKRYVSFFLAVVIVLSMQVPINAVSSSNGQELPVVGVLYDNSFYVSLDNKFSLLSNIDQGITKTLLWNMMDKVVSSVGYGGFTSYRDLSSACASVNRYFSDAGVAIWNNFSNAQAAYLQFAITNVFSKLYWVISEHPDYGYVIVETGSGVTLCNSAGAFPYYKTVVDTSDPDSDLTESLGGKWVREDQISTPILYNVVNEATLYDMGQALKDTGKTVNQNKIVQFNECYQVIMSTIDDHGFQFVYCDSKGRPYAYRPDSNQWAQENNNNYYTDNSTSSDDDTVIFNQGDTENNTLIDVDSNTVWFPDGTLYYISQLVYDESTKTYYVDAHSEYDIDNNYYITNNYYYEYHINYTSITYIGATEEYNKTYELYYQLPDGRSSADLTAEDLLALNTAIDVVPYIRVPDDIDIRALYHFDGNVKDSSYWNHMGYFDWRSGASLTYMEANAFNGALYLDETFHSFAIILPDFLGTDDFTFQFRYYQSATEAPQNDSSISIGGHTVLRMNGSHYLDSDGNSLLQTSVGSWNELCFMRKDGTLYFYVNGVLDSSWEFSDRLSNEILFTFGSGQQTFKYLDELRVVTSALYDLSGYTPTSVPFDTNLALVLPDTKVPVADGYWKITSSHENLLEAYDLADWSFVNFSHHQYLHNKGSLIEGFSNSVECYGNPSSPKTCFPHFSYLGDINDMLSAQSSAFVGHEFIYNQKGDLLPFDNFKLDGQIVCPYGISSTVMTGGYASGFTEGSQFYLPPGDYVLSMVASDGRVGSLYFNYTDSSPVQDRSLVFNGYRIGLKWSFNYNSDWPNFGYFGILYIMPTSAEAYNSFVYLELVEGTSTDLKAEYVEDVAVLDADSMSTPTLAVRTDLDITGYQIGGVRPSLPDKGLVWALVEDGRITSLQIYNGQAWEAVDGRIWTGSRWVPYYAYDVLLLKDMYDIIEADPSQEYIYTEAGFWSWLQRAWGQMMAKLEEIRLAITGGSVPDDLVVPGGSDDPTSDEDGGWSFIDLLVLLRDGTWKIVTGVVSTGVDGLSGLAEGVTNVGHYFDAYDPDGSSNILGIYNYGGDDIWD